MSKKALYGVVILLVLLGILLMATTRDSEEQDSGETQGSYVSWSEALVILNRGEVDGVAQTHDLDVELFLKDGSSIRTKEPTIDEIFKEVTKCGNVCEGITLATE